VGVKYGREYSDIIKELSAALQELPDAYTFFQMNPEDWTGLSDQEQQELIRTLADDVVFALGEYPRIPVGGGTAEYDGERHILKVFCGPKVFIINLI
jgi:hypothetical protein